MEEEEDLRRCPCDEANQRKKRVAEEDNQRISTYLQQELAKLSGIGIDRHGALQDTRRSGLSHHSIDGGGSK